MANVRAKKTAVQRSGLFLLFLHCACYLLVVIYVNMFQFWAWLSRTLGHGMLAKTLPILVTLVVLFVIAYRFIERVNKGYQINFVFLGLGIVTAFLALAIPDPAVPVKRIHVAEYILLSFMVRYVLSYRLQGVDLLVFTALVTALYGVHDEMLQGLHSLRYYGWRDITVNGVAGVSGAMLGYGLVSFARAEGKNVPQQKGLLGVSRMVQFVLLLGAVAWQIFYLYHHRTGTGPLLSILPVVICSIVIGGTSRHQVFSSTSHHGLQALYWLALGLIVYPLLGAMTGMEFL